MLAHDRVIFTERHFFRGIARVFLGCIEKASVSSAEQFDFDSGWLRHGPFLFFEMRKIRKGAQTPRFRRGLMSMLSGKVKQIESSLHRQSASAAQLLNKKAAFTIY
jgi:hypothetical protein